MTKPEAEDRRSPAAHLAQSGTNVPAAARATPFQADSSAARCLLLPSKAMPAHVRVLWGVASVALALSGCSDVESGSSGGSGASGESSPDAAVAFTVSAEQTLGSVELSLATASQRLGRVVARSGEYLAFHRDERFGSGWYATRVAADGNVIDPKGTRLIEEQDEEPDAAAGLSGYAFSSVKCAGECEVVLTHLGTSGPEVSVTRTVLERSDSYHMSDAHVGRTDQGFLVVWTRAAKPASPPSGGESSIGVPPEARAMRIGPDGEVLDAKPTYLGKVRTGQLVGTGSKLMMIGRDSSGLFAAPVVTSRGRHPASQTEEVRQDGPGRLGPRRGARHRARRQPALRVSRGGGGS